MNYSRLGLIISPIYLVFLILCAGKLHAHQPDLSSIMLYEQHGKRLFVMKSSLTAYEDEIDFQFGKNAYKTPEEFRQLVSRRFETTCQISVNNEKIKFRNIVVILGHETTLFAELENAPSKITSLYLKNTFFKDIPGSQCELILSANGAPQKQYILSNANRQQVKLIFQNAGWVVDESNWSFFGQ